MSFTQDPIDNALDALYADGPDDATTAAAQTRLAATLETVLPPKAYYDLIPDSPVGPVWVAATKIGLIAIDYHLTEAEFTKHVLKKAAVRLERGHPSLQPFLSQVTDYLNGAITRLDLPLDLSATTPFQRTVLQAALRVPRGQVVTYAEIAKQIGKPKAFRAVGQALRRNPIPIVIPCHRVIASDGTLGGYAGEMGSQRKIKLLKLEGVMLA